MPPQTSQPIESLTNLVTSPKSQISQIKKMPRKMMLIFLGVILTGVLSGYLLSTKAGTSTALAPGATSTATEVGISDEKILRDCAQGIIEANEPTDNDTEGSHKLIREGGPSQTLYMTSSILSLDGYIGKKVEVCGETVQSRKVSWFMDIGRLKLLE